jgi:hypothetical protein
MYIFAFFAVASLLVGVLLLLARTPFVRRLQAEGSALEARREAALANGRHLDDVRATYRTGKDTWHYPATVRVGRVGLLVERASDGRIGTGRPPRTLFIPLGTDDVGTSGEDLARPGTPRLATADRPPTDDTLTLHLAPPFSSPRHTLTLANLRGDAMDLYHRVRQHTTS